MPIKAIKRGKKADEKRVYPALSVYFETDDDRQLVLDAADKSKRSASQYIRLHILPIAKRDLGAR